jgi:hypothetical protein
MKLMLALALLCTSALAEPPTLQNLTKSEVEDVSKEFAANFSHTTVSAPTTEGIWGLEAGILAGRIASPALKEVVDSAGGEGSDFSYTYHAGVFARAHFPLDLFAELTYLPAMTIEEVDVENKSIGFGWNAGGFFGLPLDLAIGAAFSNAEVSYTQGATPSFPGESQIKVTPKSQMYFVGMSKQFLFFTPYAKAGVARSTTDVSVNTNFPLFSFTNDQSETLTSTGFYGVIGANVQLLFLRLGIEAARILDVQTLTGKLSLSF